MSRPSARERGYNARWDTTAVDFLHSHPLCIGCLAIGVQSEATVVDHILPHAGDSIRFWNDSNLQPACAWHHNAIKPTLERRWREGRLSDAGLRLNSPSAVTLTRQKYRYPVGADGFAIKPHDTA